MGSSDKELDNMTDEPQRAAGPSLDDDEATLRSYADGLVTAVAAVALNWMTRLVRTRRAELAGAAQTQAALEEGAAELVRELRELLEQDIADQSQGPLEVIRQAVRFPAQVLAAAGVAHMPRDDFAQRNFPNDHYDLSPASFADIDPSLHEPGLMWGAAKAHVHLRRRRDN